MAYKHSTESLDQTFWTQATWVVDPANSTGLASDNNTGLDAAHPVLSYNGGVVAKWGTRSPILRQDTTFTWLSSQPVGGADPVLFTAIMSNATATIEAALPAPIHAGVLAGTVPKNRATGQTLAANLGFAGVTTNMLVRNTTLGKESFAWVYVASLPVSQLTQPFASATLPLPPNPVPAAVDTWADGDTFEIYDLVQINLAVLDPTIAAFQPPNFPVQLEVHFIKGASADGVSGDNNVYIGNDVNLIESCFDTFIVSEHASSDDQIGFMLNCSFGTGVDITAGALQTVSMLGGCILQSSVPGMCSWSFFGDAIIDTTAAGGGVGLVLGSGLQIARSPATFNFIAIFGTIAMQGVGQFGFGGGAAWGSGTIDAVGSARIPYTAPAATTFQPGISLKLNGQANANAFNPATGLWSAPLAITPANLDLAFGAGGFGGLAVNVGGASFTSQNTP